VTEAKAYTTAIIAAVPAENDPVHQVVAEDAHVTLQFLGEAADLSDDQVTEIKQTLEMLASVVYPFDADISGTAELGPDKAQVLIVQSELLTKIREMLGMTGAVSTAVANSKQFPNWIPHLTLAYEGEMPDVDAFTTVTFGSLELWLAEEHNVYELAQAAPVIAAGEHVFEEGLHPRGADGRFIEKFGVIKFLTGLGWKYGKVEGIYSDPHSGATKLTVTPSDLAGKTSGASIVLSPKQVYRAPTAKAHLSTSAVGVKKVGGQAGSNQGGLYEIPKATPSAGGTSEVEKFYVKKPKTPTHGKNEALANALYEEAGVPVPEVDLHNDGQLYSKIVAGQQDMSQQLNNPEWTDQVRRNFAVDAWLGNRDVFGMTYDNILTDAQGVPWRIDNGGALLFRAMGEKKTDFGSKVTELDAFRQGKKAKIFGPGMTKAQELDGAERVLAISPGQIDDMVSEHGLPKSLADTLKARRAYIADYYGLPLPESQQPAEAEGPTSASLVDAPDIAENNGKSRNWFKVGLTHLAFTGQAGDMVEFPDGSTQLLGVDENQQALSIVGEQAQQLGWIQKYGPDAQVFLKKSIDPAQSRPEHGSKLLGSDLSQQRWKRGDAIVSEDGEIFHVLGWNDGTGAVLVQSGANPPLLLDTLGKDKTGMWTVDRWDPPAVDTPAVTAPEAAPLPVQTEQQAIDVVDDNLATVIMTPGPAAPTHTIPPQPGKTGQAAVAETAIKADLDQPLPEGKGTPAPAKTTAPGGAKTMVIGDGTEAATGDAVTSKKDGKTYTFVKPKGQYAVVTDPNSDTPDKQLLKLASTMTQPGKAPAADPGAVEKPKTATGEVPALGMMAEAKDGWAGEITLISPDGKFVFITDANGKRKRKSTGTVSITSLPTPAGDGDGKGPGPGVPAAAPGPLKAYGPPPQNLKAAKEALGITATDLDDPADLNAGDMVIVGYGDGTVGLEPYSGQPMDSLLTNTTGKVAVHGTIKDYLGTVSAGQFAAATQTQNHDSTYFVAWNGTLMQTNGQLGPNGGLMLWDNDDPNSYALEIPLTGQNLTVLNTLPGGDLPDPGGISSAQFLTPGTSFPASPAPLYGDEAKTLADWKGQLAEGSQISLDGQNWMTVSTVLPSGSVDVKDPNGTFMAVSVASQATWVIKAPDLADGDQPDPAFAQSSPDLPDPVSTGKKKIGDLVHGDVIIDGNGDTSIIDYVDDQGTPNEVSIKALGEDWASPSNPNLQMDHLGNLTDGPVPVPLDLVAQHLYPGAKVELGPDWHVQLVSYPQQKNNGNWQFAAMKVGGDPENISLVEFGNAMGSDITGNVPVPVHLDTFTSWQEAGSDGDTINALFNTATIEDQNPVDHHAQMTDQGIPFGTAGYPIYFNEPSGTYFRQGSAGLQEWDAEGGTWNNVFGTVEGKQKVWDGVPFTGQLKVPDTMPGSFLGESYGNPLDYQPEPGELVQAATYDLGNGKQQTAIIAFPDGNPDGPGFLVNGGNVTTPNNPKKTSIKLPDNWKEDTDFGTPVTLHDPFADTPDVVDTVTHHEGPQPPADLGAKLQSLGYTPSPGDTLWVTALDTGAVAPLVKQEDGTYRKILSSGNLGTHVFTPEDLKNYDVPGHTVSHYTWTYLPAGADAPNTVQGLPDGFQPYVPGDGQALLKVTLPNGKQNVYLQKQPGAGWYEMGPDGTVLEASDAVKSDFVVQQKLAGKGSQAAKYELLHPLPEGVKPTGQTVPTLTNHGGDWTPDPHQKVVALSSHEGDTDPWFFVQDTPGGQWMPAPNTVDSGLDNGVTDAAIQGKLEQEGNWKLVYDGNGHAAVDAPDKTLPPTFTDPLDASYTPKEGEEVHKDAEGYLWVKTPEDGKFHAVQPAGTLSKAGLGQQSWDDSMPGSQQLWPAPSPSAPETAPGTPAGAQTFSGYVPQPGDKIISYGAPAGPKTYFVAQAGGNGDYKPIKDDGTINPSGGVTQSQVDSGIANVESVWPPDASTGPGGIFGGYQTQAGDSVLQLQDGGTNPFYVKKADSNVWQQVTTATGELTSEENGYTQATMEWAAQEYGVTELQGTLKPGPVSAPEPLDTSGEAYAGVAETTHFSAGNYHFGSYTPNQDQQKRIDAQGYLVKGQSLYALEDATGAFQSSAVLIRNSDGSWWSVLANGDSNKVMNSDAEFEAWAKANSYVVHKAQFGAPAQAPPVSTAPPAVASFSGWAEKGIPDPASFGQITDASEGHGAKAGDWVFIAGVDGPGSGIFTQLSKDWLAADGSKYTIGKMQAYKNGQPAGQMLDLTNPIEWDLALDNPHSTGTYLSGKGSGIPAEAPSAPVTPVPATPAAPAYPGAQKPSQEDINAWGGDLTKDGHIPSAGMYVSGKGPMTGKIVSVSKDKTKATVLTGDGKKTTRLISALKTDPTANYTAYAAPVTAKDIPQGMPLAVDTVGEALQKTAQDGKFRAILSGHPGVSGGQMTVTKTTAPSGTVYNRVHLTLTPDQRDQLVATLSGTGEKGDWAKSSKMSDQVAIGDQLPMRKSSTNNPDGTPRWKVDPAVVPPTHKVSKVEDDPNGTGVKIVTMTDINTGEEITSRFHPGKNLTVYTWDPNKPKVMTAGALSLSEVAKAQGWQHVKDGGISAISGGADKGQLYNEPGKAVTKSALGQVKSTWDTLRNVSADGVVIETVDPKGPSTNSTTGVTVISVPAGVDETALGAALAKLGIDYRPMTQDDAKNAVRGTLRTLLSLDTSDVDTAKGWSDEKLFAQAGKTMGISDLGWQDVLIGVDETTGKTSFFWSDRARNALAAKAKYNVVYRAATTANAAQIVSTVKYGSASSILKKTTGMLDGSGSVGNGASASTDNGNHAGHGSYASASSHTKLPSSNKFASYKTPGMMIYHRPEAVLGRIMDYRVAGSDAFGMGHGSGSDHLAYATSMPQVKDYFLGGGLPTEAVGFVAVQSAAERDKAIAQLKADGFATINGRPVEDIVITKAKAATLSPNDLPPVTNPSNARPILDLPTSYDAPAPAAGATTGGEAAA
jgi:2'-5' RNA ligase